jgi:hypothetical protein
MHEKQFIRRSKVMERLRRILRLDRLKLSEIESRDERLSYFFGFI